VKSPLLRGIGIVAELLVEDPGAAAGNVDASEGGERMTESNAAHRGAPAHFPRGQLDPPQPGALGMALLHAEGRLAAGDQRPVAQVLTGQAKAHHRHQ
jgi:hypothetical protein